MIQITAYVRDEEDKALWSALGNKTQFLHDALHSTSFRVTKPQVRKAKLVGDDITLEPIED